MALKMPAARDENGLRITVGMAEQGKYSNLLKCEFCDVPVVFVRTFTRQDGDNVTVVEQHFRRKQKQEHSETCRYNVPGQVKIIARESESGLFAAIQGNRYELRLLAVKQALEKLRELDQKKRDSHSDVIQGTVEKAYVEAEKRLGSYINSAQRVLKLRASCEDNSDIEDALHLVFDGVYLSWNNFYFEHEDYFRCFSQVSRSTVNVPIAVKGVIKSKKVVNTRTGKASVINLVERNRKTNRADILDVICLSIWSYDLNAFESYEEGREILTFGIWGSRSSGFRESSSMKKDSPIKTFHNYELSLWPTIRSQLCAVGKGRIKLPSVKHSNL
jgi:hypothetical protein